MLKIFAKTYQKVSKFFFHVLQNSWSFFERKYRKLVSFDELWKLVPFFKQTSFKLVENILNHLAAASCSHESEFNSLGSLTHLVIIGRCELYMA